MIENGLYATIYREESGLPRLNVQIPIPKLSFMKEKVLLCVGWDHEDIMHLEDLNVNETLNKHLYCVHKCIIAIAP